MRAGRSRGSGGTAHWILTLSPAYNFFVLIPLGQQSCPSVDPRRDGVLRRPVTHAVHCPAAAHHHHHQPPTPRDACAGRWLTSIGRCAYQTPTSSSSCPTRHTLRSRQTPSSLHLCPPSPPRRPSLRCHPAGKREYQRQKRQGAMPWSRIVFVSLVPVTTGEEQGARHSTSRTCTMLCFRGAS